MKSAWFDRALRNMVSVGLSGEKRLIDEVDLSTWNTRTSPPLHLEKRRNGSRERKRKTPTEDLLHEQRDYGKAYHCYISLLARCTYILYCIYTLHWLLYHTAHYTLVSLLIRPIYGCTYSLPYKKLLEPRRYFTRYDSVRESQHGLKQGNGSKPT